MSLRQKFAGALGVCLFPFAWDLVPSLPAVVAQAPVASTPRTYSATKAIRLPIQLDDKTRANLREMKLYVKFPGTEWTCAQTTPPSQTIFDFRAEKDGEYSFLFVLVDQSGRSSPANLDTRPPHQIIIVDTAKPEVNVQPLPVANRDIFLQCQVRDAHPDLASIKLEYDAGDQQWRAMELAQADTPGVFRIPHASVLEGKVRATVKDLAGNVTQRIIDLGDPTKSLTITRPKEPAVVAPEIVGKLPPPPVKVDPQMLPADVLKVEPQVLPPLDARENGPVQTGYKVPPAKQADLLEVKPPTPDTKPTTSAYNPNRPKPMEPLDPVVIPDPPAPPIIDPKATEGTAIALPPDVKQAPEMTPAPDLKQTGAKVDPFLPQMNPNSKPAPAPVRTNPGLVESRAIPPRTEQPFTDMRPASPVQGTHPIIGTTRCTLDYTVENVIVGGQTRMEFWATKDNGRSWSRVQDEAGGRSPAKLVLPGDGTYGIRINANASGQAPHQSEAPDCWVEVDTIPPTVRLLPPVLGTGADAGTLTIQWMAHDKNLMPDSIAIFHASRPDGPWLPIASNVRNDGTYRWLIPAGIGAEVYLRLEASDRAGNTGRNELRDPVPMPQPKVRVIGIGPSR